MIFTGFAGEYRPLRWALLTSLAVNLFFIGSVGALVLRSYLAGPPLSAERPHTAEARIDRLAATLPAADADKLRAQFATESSSAEAARETYDRALEQVKSSLRAEPFDASALRAAMANARSARLALDQVLQDIIATAVSRMSSTGRDRLADWTPPSHTVTSCPH
jgi:uncharacterized membrane protein